MSRQRWNAIFSTIAASLLVLGALALLLAPAYGASSPAFVYVGAVVALVVGAGALLTGTMGRADPDRG